MVRKEGAAKLEAEVKVLRGLLQEGVPNDALTMQITALEGKIRDLRVASRGLVGEMPAVAGQSVASALKSASTGRELLVGSFQGVLTYLRDHWADQAGEQVTKGLAKAFSGDGVDFSGLLSKLADSLQSVPSGIGTWLSNAFSGMSDSGFGSLLSGLGSVMGFSTGGYTGPGAVNEFARFAHKGEVIFEQPAVREIGLGNLLDLRRTRKLSSVAAGGLSGVSAASLVPQAAPADSGGWSGNINAAMYLDPEEAAQAMLSSREGEARVIEIFMKNKSKMGIR